MARLPASADRAIRDFATSMGLTPKEAADGSYSFRFERGDVLSFTAAADERRVLISLAFRPNRVDEGLDAEMLAAARRDPTTDRLVHAGRASDGTMVLAVSAPVDGMDLPLLDGTFGDLRALRGAFA